MIEQTYGHIITKMLNLMLSMIEQRVVLLSSLLFLAMEIGVEENTPQLGGTLISQNSDAPSLQLHKSYSCILTSKRSSLVSLLYPIYPK